MSSNPADSARNLHLVRCIDNDICAGLTTEPSNIDTLIPTEHGLISQQDHETTHNSEFEPQNTSTNLPHTEPPPLTRIDKKGLVWNISTISPDK